MALDKILARTVAVLGTLALVVSTVVHIAGEAAELRKKLADLERAPTASCPCKRSQ
jgi:hypothetical protein